MYFNQVIVSSNEQIEYFSSQNDKKKAVHPIMRPPSPFTIKKNLPINKTDAVDRQAPDSLQLYS